MRVCVRLYVHVDGLRIVQGIHTHHRDGEKNERSIIATDTMKVARTNFYHK